MPQAVASPRRLTAIQAFKQRNDCNSPRPSKKPVAKMRHFMPPSLKIRSFSDIVKPRGGELGELDKIAANRNTCLFVAQEIHLLIQSVAFEKEILLWV